MKDKFGLRPNKKDNRDFVLGRVFALPKLEELPTTFKLGEPIIKDQGQTDYCSAYTSCGMSEFQEGVELYAPYSFALSKKISGDPDAWGQTPRDAMKAHVQYGAIESRDVAMNPANLTGDEERYLSKYPASYLEEALKHRKKSYFKVSGMYAPFDTIRASMYKFKADKQCVALGVIFSWDLREKYLSGVVDEGFGHAIYSYGWDGDYLLVANSYGKEAGENGIHYLHKDTVNYFAKKYTPYMEVDMPVGEAKEMNRRAEWNYAGGYGRMLIRFRRLWNK